MVLPLGQKYALAFSTWLNIAKCMGFLCQHVPMVYLSALMPPKPIRCMSPGKLSKRPNPNFIWRYCLWSPKHWPYFAYSTKTNRVFQQVHVVRFGLGKWLSFTTPRSSRFLGMFPNPHHDESMRCFPSSHLLRMKLIKGKLVALLGGIPRDQVYLGYPLTPQQNHHFQTPKTWAHRCRPQGSEDLLILVAR